MCRTRSKNAQEAHEAIRPTQASNTPDKGPPTLEARLARLYDLIWRRTLACQMASARIHQACRHLPSCFNTKMKHSQVANQKGDIS